MSEDATRHMAHALALGRRGLGKVWPNPAVGCVIVNEGRVVGRGRTADGGRPHAETRALAMAGDRARGATAYVTLEPCAHEGKTPPCTEALIAAGITCVVIAHEDPDERVSGKGVAQLRAAGLEVKLGVLEDRARHLQAGFLCRVRDGRPHLTLKLASTLDGRIATQSGDSQWITGPEARRLVHAMRHSHDAVLVGGGTARADDPTLTARDIGTQKQPVRIVTSRELNLPFPSKLTKTIAESPVWLIHGEDTPELAEPWSKAGADLIPVTEKDGQIDPQALMDALGERGLTRVFCEGGGAFAASLLKADLIDELVVFGAGKVLGAEGVASIGPMAQSALSEAPRFELAEVRPVGGDVMHRWLRPA